MATTKYHGKQTVLMYAATVNTAPTVDLSGSSRTISVNEQGQEIDVSTRDDLVADSTAYLTNPPQRSVQLQGLDTTPQNSRTWDSIDVGDTGRVAVYPLGSSPTGSPYQIGNVVCTQSNYSSPHDNAATYDVQWRVSGTWLDGTT
jgi:hypothetical protein